MLAVSDLGGLTKAELKAYASFAQTLVLLATVPLYARLAARWSRRRLVFGINVFFALHLLVFCLLRPGVLFAHVPYIGIAFYVWVGIFNVAVLTQFWVFASDLYNAERGQRIFPLIALGASIGAVTGAWVTARLVASGLVSTGALPILAVALLAGATAALGATGDGAGFPLPVASPEPCTRNTSRPLELVLRNKYLLGAALLMVVVNWVGTNGETLLFASVQTVLEREVSDRGLGDALAVERFISDGTTAFYGDFFFWTNAFALLLQALVVSRLVRLGGFELMVMALPVIALLSHSAAATVPVLGVLKVMKITENATLHSVNFTAHQLLWLPTTSEIKYKARPLVDTIFVRLGDVLAAVSVYLGTQWLGLPMTKLYVLNVALAVLWLGGAAMLAREHRRLSLEPSLGCP
jgi:AAA family ATP:ADP antiporter